MLQKIFAPGENGDFARPGYSRDAIFSLLHGFDVSWSPRGHPKPLHSTGLHGCGIDVAWLKGSYCDDLLISIDGTTKTLKNS